MATDQVLQWINDDLTLSQSVGNFETDFSSGYLFGEILSSFDQVDIKQFTKKKNKEAKVNNFYLIENALRKLKVKFDGKLVHQIMEEERGAALRLLYQIKLATAKLSVPSDHPDEMSMTNLKNGKMHTILKNKQDATMEMSSSIPPPTVGGKDIRTAKQVRADKRTIAYDVAQKNLFDSAQQAHEAEMREIMRITQTQRQSNIDKLKDNQQFMKDWFKEGKDNWRINQNKRAEAISKVQYFEDREVGIYKKKLENELNTATSEQINGVSDFEKNLQKLGIQQGISMEEAIKKQEEKRGIPPGQIQNFSYAATMNKIKETKKNSDFAGKERDRRRRKMIVDQQNAQTKLDQEASEEALISKLLQQTSDEQRDAFIDIRVGRCKQNDVAMRKDVALKIEEKRRVENEAAEEVRKQNVKQVEADRAKENEIRRHEAKKAAREKKMVKRGLNIEIASGLVDLILDLADETYEVVSQNETHQIPNPEWRDFVSIFKSGKKVSLRNVQQVPVAKDDGFQLERLDLEDGIQAHQVQKKLWKDQSLINFYEYVSGSGAFNIPQLAPEMWHKYQDQYEPNDDEAKEEKQYEIPFIAIKLQEDPDLVQIIDKMYNQNQSMLSNQEVKPVPCEALMQPTIKLSVLGRAFSGRKTIAKQIQDTLGQDVAILHIDEVIKEAIEYVTPKKVDESVVADPKAKKPPKGKEEPVVTDIFEGKNNAQYKSYAQQIKENYFSGETLPRKVDLAELVLDDALLNGLVVERLKLLMEGKPVKGPEQIKAGVAREREILKQLEDIEQAAQAAAADPKAKNKGPKGGPNPDQLNAELNEIKSFKASGWVLIGYPQQLSQAKLLEQDLTGFVSKLDKSKSESIEIKESWKNLVVDELDSTIDSSYRQQTVQSGFDAFMFLETPESECIKRTEGLTDDEHGNEKRIQTANETFDSKIQPVKLWCEQFGLVDSQGACKVTLNQELSVPGEEWSEKEAVKEATLNSLKKVMAFKQVQFDAQRQVYKEALDLQKSVDNLGSNKDVAAEQNSQVASQVQMSNPEANSNPNILNDASAELPVASQVDDASPIKIAHAVANDKSSVDGGTTNKSSKRTKQNMQRYEINDQQKIQNWEQMVNDYYRDSLQRFNDLVKQRKRIFSLFSQTQSNFIDFICRDAPYQRRVTEFCDNFNRFSEQYPDLRGKEETRSELLKRVSILNETLWQTVLDRKNVAIEERHAQTALMVNGWDTREKSKLITFVAQLMELEFERFRVIVQVATSWVVNQDIDLAGLCKRLDERNTSTFEIQQDGSVTSPMLEQVVSYLHGVISQLIQDPCVKQQPGACQIMILKERANFHLRCNILKSYAMLLLIEINNNTEEISSAFEDWIITSVKKENALASSVIKQIQTAVKNDASYLEGIKVGGVNLEDSIQRVQLDEGLPQYLTSFKAPKGMAAERLEIETLSLMYSQFKQNSIQELLDSQTFISLMIANYQSYKVPDRWRNLSFQAIVNLINKFAQKPLSNQMDTGNLFNNLGDERHQFVNWKKIFVLFALASTVFPSDQQLQTYGSELAYYGSCVSLEDFTSADAWFDTVESANSPSQMIKATNSVNNSTDADGEEQEVYDTKRLKELKKLLWMTVKRTNEEGVRPADLVAVIKDIKNTGNGNEKTFGDLIA